MQPEFEPDPEFTRVVLRLAANEKDGVRGDIKIGPYTAFMLIGAIQLVLRHPTIGEGTKQAISDLSWDLAKWLTNGFGEDDPDRAILKKLLNMGYDTEYDL